MSGKPITDAVGEYRHAMIKGVVGIPLFILFMLFVAFAESKDWLRQGKEVLYILASLFIAAFLIGTVGTRRVQRGKLVTALSSELGIMLFVLLLGLLTKESEFFNMLLLWSLIVVLCGAFFAAAIPNGARKNRYRKRKYNKA